MAYMIKGFDQRRVGETLRHLAGAVEDGRVRLTTVAFDGSDSVVVAMRLEFRPGAAGLEEWLTALSEAIE